MGNFPPGQHLDPRQQFGKRIRLGKVVVAAGAQAGDTVIDLPERRQDQRRGLISAFSEIVDNQQPVTLGQHAVDDQNVVAAIGGHRRTGLAVAGVVGDMAGLAQGFHQKCGRVAVILDQQDSHVVTIAAWRGRFTCLDVNFQDVVHSVLSREADVSQRQ